MRTPQPARARVLRTVAGLVAGLVATTATVTVTGTTVSAAPTGLVSPSVVVLPAPTGLKAVRDAADPNNFVISWNAVDGALDHYNVSVFQNGVDNVTVVPAGTTKLAVTGVNLATTYRITVGTRDANGEGTTTGYYWLYPVLPGSVLALSAVRDAGSPDVGKVSWSAPTKPGYGPITAYNLFVTRLVDNVVVMKQSSLDLSAPLTGLDPARSYSVKVVAVNAYGEGPVATTTIASDRPGTPTGLAAARDIDNPSLVHLKWVAPTATGSSAIEYYEVMYGIGLLKDTVTVKLEATTDVPLDATRVGVVAVRACNATGCGYLGAPLTVASTTAVPTPAAATTNTSVLVTYTSGVVSVQTTGIVGSTLTYPRLVVRITPTMDNGGFKDTQWGQNGAGLLNFATVPAGNFTITVHGVATDGTETEIARKVIVTEGYGTVPAKEMQVVIGKATVTDGAADISNIGENRVLSNRGDKDDDENMVIRTKAKLKSGSGYAVWVRAEMDSSKRLSAFALQYDPVYANAFILRNWYQGKECPTPVAKTAYNSTFKEGDEHEIVVVAKGNSIWATVDGKEVFRINDVSKAVAASNCGFPEPRGKRTGLRSWNGNSVEFREIEVD